jgi:HD-GYP domain-containing protein (c-di-GMP phosphodiesterase class II)
MLKRIAVEQLRPGMYLHELCGFWIDHPFWKITVTLRDAHDVASIVDAGIKEVWIDAAKGLDVGASAAKQQAGTPSGHALGGTAAPLPGGIERIALADELSRATRICETAKQAVTAMFQEVRMGKAVAAEDALPLVEEISQSVVRNPEALISLARLKTADNYTYMHSVAVCGLMISLSRMLALDAKDVRQAGLAGLLHDVGKMAIPLAVLNKPGKLTDEEFILVKNHPREGHRILVEGGGAPPIALDVVLHHHEKVDGSGYPARLKGDEISLFSKMGAVCDVYDAITSDRPYKKGWNPAESVSKMAQWCAGHFDETVFQAFVKTIGIYPVGTLVRLNADRLAVVLEQSPTSLLAPTVKAFFCAKTRLRLPPKIIELARAGGADRIETRENPADWGISNVDQLWRE